MYRLAACTTKLHTSTSDSWIAIIQECLYYYYVLPPCPQLWPHWLALHFLSSSLF